MIEGILYIGRAKKDIGKVLDQAWNILVTRRLGKEGDHDNRTIQTYSCNNVHSSFCYAHIHISVFY